MRGYRRIVAWGLTVIGLGCGLGRAEAGLLDPSSPLYTAHSQGDVILGSGTYAFTLGTSGPTLQMYNGVTFSTVATGFVSNGVNVFDFHSLQVQAGATISVTQSSASGPIALLSSTTISMAGSIDVSAIPSTPFGGPGAANLFSGGRGNIAVAPGGAGPGSTIVTGGGGGGFGGSGQSAASLPIYSFLPGQEGLRVGTVAGGYGGGGYASLLDGIRGGSAGGFGGGAAPGTSPGSGFAGSPGLGGGAIELGAIGSISVAGTIHADGGQSIALNSQIVGGGGGGSGGGILIHASTVNLSGTLTAVGGAGSAGGVVTGNGTYSATGGTGGGGQIVAIFDKSFSLTSSANIQVGNGVFLAATVPEPSSLAMLGLAALGGLAVTRRRRQFLGR